MGWGGYRFLKQIWQPWSVVRGRACVVGHVWSCAVAAHDRGTHSTPPGVGWVPLPQTNMAAVCGRACVVGCARSVVRGRALSVMRGRAWSCAVGRASSCVVVRTRSCARGRAWSCRSARFAASTAVLPASRPALPWHERTSNI